MRFHICTSLFNTQWCANILVDCGPQNNDFAPLCQADEVWSQFLYLPCLFEHCPANSTWTAGTGGELAAPLWKGPSHNLPVGWEKFVIFAKYLTRSPCFQEVLLLCSVCVYMERDKFSISKFRWTLRALVTHTTCNPAWIWLCFWHSYFLCRLRFCSSDLYSLSQQLQLFIVTYLLPPSVDGFQPHSKAVEYVPQLLAARTHTSHYMAAFVWVSS